MKAAGQMGSEIMMRRIGIVPSLVALGGIRPTYSTKSCFYLSVPITFLSYFLQNRESDHGILHRAGGRALSNSSAFVGEYGLMLGDDRS